jgi:hypothetical protein
LNPIRIFTFACLGYILILSSHLCLGLETVFFLSDVSNEILYLFVCLPVRAGAPTSFDRPDHIRHRAQIIKSLIMQFSRASCHFRPHRSSWDSSVGIATVEEFGFDSRQGQESFFLSTASRLAPGATQPPLHWVPGALSPGVKRQGREADHSPPSSAGVKNGGAVPPLPLWSSGRS